MKKSKILSIALVAAMAASMAVVSVSALESADIKSHTVGVTGSFNNWGNNGEADVALTDDDGDGVYEGTIEIAEVTADMISEAMTDKGPNGGGAQSRGFNAIQFKVRLDGTWDNSWGDYEEAFVRTENSQTNCAVKESDVEVGKPLNIHVKFDTTASANEDEFPLDDPDVYMVWPVTYTAEIPAEESKEESAVPTGDTTSAVALVAVVIASLGAAVVMTKKASSKE